MTNWTRFQYQGDTAIGTVEGDTVTEYRGELLDDPTPSGRSLPLAEVTLLAPYRPNSILALWNNFYERATEEGQAIPEVPLYFMKPSSSVTAPGTTIYRPRGHQGRVIFEAELGVVIGRTCSQVSEAEAGEYVFGYTGVNDVTAVEVLSEDKSFKQWTRCKGYDTFTPLGPTIATDLDLSTLRIKAIQNGETRQDYPVSDMIFSPHRIVSMLSHYQTLEPGDLIACGTSVGARTMKPGSSIDVEIEGIGTLSNKFADYA